MKTVTSKLIAACAILIATNSLFAQTTQPSTRNALLNIGDPAPALATGGFAQGTPIASFKKGHVYVIEFWATWCGPCRAAMPHISKLSEDYKDKVTFIGMDGSERKPEDGSAFDLMTIAKEFIAKNPGRMTYNVAIDTPNGDMIRNWFEASGQHGIPCTFIVDQNSNIAYIGHPMKMEGPLAQIVAGTFDAKKFVAVEKAKLAVEAERVSAERAALAPTESAMRNKDYAGALKQLDVLQKDHPDLAARLDITRFSATLYTDPQAALAMIRTAIAEKNRAHAYNFSDVVSTTRKLPPELYDVAAEVFQSFAEPSTPGNSFSAYMNMSRVYSAAGDNAKALTYAEKALADFKSVEPAGSLRLEAMEKKVAAMKSQSNQTVN